jgi:hypothetical protein
MPIEILETTNGYYIPMDGIWQSEEDKSALVAANRKFEELKELDHPYIRIVESHHPYSTGYWIELNEDKIRHQSEDFIIKEYSSKQIEP